MPLPLPSWKLHYLEATASSGWLSEDERRARAHAADLDGPSLSGGLRYTASIESVFALSGWLDAGAWSTRGGDATVALGVIPQLTLHLLPTPLVTLYLGVPIGGSYVRARDALGLGPAALWGLRTGVVVGARATFDVGAMQGVTIRSEVGWRATGLWSDAPGATFGMIHQLHLEVGVGIAFR